MSESDKHTTPALKATNISKWFRQPMDFQVLKSCNLEVQRGEFVSVMGKSGCGKSTLLYILSTMDTDYEGKLEIDGVNVTGKSADDLAKLRGEKIGFVFQFHYLLPEFTVLQNVMIPALKLGKRSREEIEVAAMEKLRLLEITDQAKKKANMLSGGQKQRVAIARSLINDPMILMGDEPTGNLDSRNANIVFDLLRDISSQNGQSLLVVTHDEEFARRTDRIIIMQDGEIVE